jgi:Family of unknown function (DUF6247)
MWSRSQRASGKPALGWVCPDHDEVPKGDRLSAPPTSAAPSWQAVTVWGMTAAAVKPAFANASPAEIRAALLPEEQPNFDREYQRALEVAARR